MKLIDWRIGELANRGIIKILKYFFTSCLKTSKFGNNINRREYNTYGKLKKANYPKE